MMNLTKRNIDKQGRKYLIFGEKIIVANQITLKSAIIEIPEPPSNYNADDIRRIREKSHYSQGIFAKVLNVSIKTVQSWESGTRVPSHAALRLLEIVDKGFYRPKITKHVA